MTEITYALRIEKVGDREAIKALDELNAKGRKVIEDVNAATGRALGDIAVAYQRGGTQVKASLEAIADGHRQNVREMEREASAADALGRRQGLATLQATRGLEQVIRTGQVAGSGVDSVLASVSQLAFGFGMAGPIIGAIAVSTSAMIGLFRKVSEEAKKAADDAVREFSRVAHMDVAGQGRTVQELYNGDPFSPDAAKRPGVPALEREAAAARARIAAGTSTFTGAFGIQTKEMTADARAAAAELAKVNAELQRRRDLMASITTGSMPAAAATEAGENAARAGAKAPKRVVETVDADTQQALAALNHLTAESRRNYAQMSADAVREFEREMDEETHLGLQQANAEAKNVAQAYNDALEQTFRDMQAHEKVIAAYATRLRDTIGSVLGQGISDGFAAAFTGKGISNAFEALTATVLSGLGSFMEQLGAEMIVVGLSLEALADALLSLNGPAAVAAGVALIAAGAGLKAVAGSFGGGSSAGRSGAGSVGAGLGSIIDRGVITPNSYSSRDATTIPMNRASNDTYNFFGPNDPGLPRWFDEVQRKRDQRGSLAGAR